MTNEEKVRAMTTEELANLINDSVDFFSCDECANPSRNKNSFCDGSCIPWILQWLKSEAVQ